MYLHVRPQLLRISSLLPYNSGSRGHRLQRASRKPLRRRAVGAGGGPCLCGRFPSLRLRPRPVAPMIGLNGAGTAVVGARQHAREEGAQV